MNRLFARTTMLSLMTQFAISAQTGGLNVLLIDGVETEEAGDLIANLEQNKPSMLVAYNCSCLTIND